MAHLTMNSTSKKKILMGLFLVLAMCFVTATLAVRLYGGPLGFTFSSGNSWFSKLNGSLIRVYSVERSTSSNHSIRVTDVWIETLFENYKSMPIRKKPIGYRLSVGVAPYASSKALPCRLEYTVDELKVTCDQTGFGSRYVISGRIDEETYRSIKDKPLTLRIFEYKSNSASELEVFQLRPR
jgi:hypothetical protein